MTAWLDRLLGRVTMYRLVLIGLGILFVVALVFTALGVVNPGATVIGMLVSFLVLNVVSYLANRLFALAFRIRPHTESTLITAGLLFFVLTPQLTPLGLGTLAVAAVIAVASKYVLAVRGRHVFNPAALGAFAIGLTGLTTGTWWVGTPWLLPFTLVLGFLILFRTRRLPMGAVYLAVGLVAATTTYALAGVPLPDAARIAALSSPLVFVAGFMLSEPLTLPPRRGQQLGYAAVAAVLYAAVPFSFGPFYNSPELALLVANLLAFLVGQRRGIRLAFAGRRQLTPTSWEFEFRTLTPVAFRPGQFVELTIPHGKTDTRGWRRVFSIASAPGDRLRFGIRLPGHSSSFKRALLELEEGAIVTGTSVGGDFVLPADPTRPLLLVAGGIGITPFVGHLEEAAATSAARDIVVVYAVSSLDDLAYAEHLERAGCRVVLASPERPATLPSGWTWIGPDRLTGEALLAAVPDAARREAFLSGPPSMVAALKAALRRAKVRRIHTDVFVGY